MSKIFYNKLFPFTLVLFSFLINISKVQAQCEIWDMTVVSECVPNTTTFNAVINFNHMNTSDSFKIQGNGHNYGYFAYSALPITLTGLEGNCTTNYEFVAKDKVTPTCTDFVVEGQVCCGTGDCNINIVDFEASNCVNNDLVNIAFDLEYNNTGNLGFDVFDQNGFVAYFLYSQLPVNITGFTAPTNQQFIYVQVCDNDNPNCCDVLEFTNPCYFSANDCEIRDMTVETNCVPGTTLFNATIDFNHSNTSDFFEVVGNGNNYGTFAYSALPIIIDGLEGNCSTQYEFVTRDVNTNNCTDFVNVGQVCCGSGSCNIQIVDLGVSDCISGDLVTITFDLEYNNTGNLGFDVFDQNGPVGYFLYSQLPVTVTSFTAPVNQQYIYVQVCDNDNPNCCDAMEFENPCYVSNNCEIWDMTVETICDTSSQLFTAIIDFNHNNPSDSFEIVGNGNNYGTYAYSALPVSIVGLEGNCSTQYEFVARDAINTSCHDFVNVGQVCCGSNSDCAVEIVEFTSSDCMNGDLVTVSFNLEYNNTGNLGFDVYGPNGFHTYYLYSQLPVTISGFPAITNQQNITLQVCDNDNSNCCDVIEFANPCYVPSNDCHIWDMTVETVCDSSNTLFNAIINFNHSNTSDSFRIQGNGIYYGTFAYGSLPITLSGLAANCTTNYEFVAIDDNSQNCSDFVNVGEVCCGNNNNCSVEIIEFTSSDCINNDIISVSFDLEYNNTGNLGFDVYGPNGFSAYFLYSQLPVTVTGIPAPTYQHNITIQVCDNDNPNCCDVIEFANPCFVPTNTCSIDSLTAEVISCDSTLFDVEINFVYSGSVSDSFKIVGNGNNYGFYAYSDLPVILSGLEANCTTNYEFIVIDQLTNSCSEDTGIGEVCCSNFNNIANSSYNIILHEADDNFDIIFNINHTLLNNCSFIVYANGDSIKTIYALDSIVEIGPLDCIENIDYNIDFYNTCTNDTVLSIVFDPEVICQTNGIDETSDFRLYYDLYSSNVVVINEDRENLMVEVFDVFGRKLFSKTTADQNYTKDISEFVSSVYFIKVSGSQSKTTKMVKAIVSNK